MIKRLDVKFLILLLATALFPMLASIYFVNEAVKTSMRFGLNPDVASSLSGSVEIHRQRIDAVKLQYDLFMTSLTTHAGLKEACLGENIPRITALLGKIVPEEIDYRSISVMGNSPLPIGIHQSPATDVNMRSLSKKAPVEWGICREIHMAFLIDPSMVEDYKTAAQHARTYEALHRAPTAYLTRRVMLVYGFFLALVLIISVWQGIFWTRRLARRIHTLSNATREVAAGRIDVQVPTGPEDEVGQLIAAFNSMVEELADIRSKMEYLQKIATWQEIARRLAHEIKNPLTPIRLAAQELKNKYRPDGSDYDHLMTQSMDIIEEEIVTLKRLVTDFSAFAKLPRIQPDPTDLRGFLTDCDMSLSHYETEYRVSMIWHIPARQIRVRIDPIMMKRVIDNLVRNGIDAMVESHTEDPRITVSTSETARTDHSTVDIRIEDTGPGIDEEIRTMLFEPYVTTRESGTGLGLAISKKIVLEHGGSLRLENMPQGGTVSIVNLPLLK